MLSPIAGTIVAVVAGVIIFVLMAFLFSIKEALRIMTIVVIMCCLLALKSDLLNTIAIIVFLGLFLYMTFKEKEKIEQNNKQETDKSNDSK